MEPQTLVPIVSLKPQQITLIGDHKQLRPIVLNQTAKDLGLERSMFERQQNLYDIFMLDMQYRMVCNCTIILQISFVVHYRKNY
jgi:superfamily I DNA and/or RNA helicase